MYSTFVTILILISLFYLFDCEKILRKLLLKVLKYRLIKLINSIGGWDAFEDTLINVGYQLKIQDNRRSYSKDNHVIHITTISDKIKLSVKDSL